MAERGRETTLQKRLSGGQPGNSNRVTHGIYRRRTALKQIDWTTQLDRRTSLYRELRERAERIVDGAGGPDVIGANRLALAPHAAQVELELACLNQAIRDQGPIDRRRNKARQLVEDRNRLIRVYRELLDTIGWNRGPKPRPTLADVVAQSSKVNNARAHGVLLETGVTSVTSVTSVFSVPTPTATGSEDEMARSEEEPGRPPIAGSATKPPADDLRPD